MKNLKYVIPLFSFLASLLFISCSEVPVIPPNGDPQIQVIDSNIFEWEFEMLLGRQIFDIYIADSNKIFLTGMPSTLFYDGSTFTTILDYSPDFWPSCINGLDENSVYIGGSNKTVYLHSQLRKWNGSSIEVIQLPLDSSKSIDYIFIENNNDIWLSTNSNKVYHYDGMNITTYYIPVPLLSKSSSIYKDLLGNLLLFGLYGIVGGQGETVHSTFRFIGDSWQLITQDTVTVNSDLSYRVLQCGTDILRTGKNMIFYFEGANWIKHTSAPNIEQISISGPSKQDFLIWARTPAGALPVYYDGAKFLLQTDFQAPYPIQSTKNVLKYKNGRYFGFFGSDLYNNALIKGRFKTNK